MGSEVPEEGRGSRDVLKVSIGGVKVEIKIRRS